MNNRLDEPVDLGALRAEHVARADRAADRALARIAHARVVPFPIVVCSRLARFAIPAALAAAAALLVVLVTRPAPGEPTDSFARIVVGNGPTAQWLAAQSRPDDRELALLLGAP